MAEYKLSASLAEHEDDVRAVVFPDPKAVISASRDGTVRLWKLLSDNPPTFDATIASHATSFVNAVAYLPPNDEYKEGLIISGGKDTVIEVRPPFKAHDDNAEALLLGHHSNICALDVDPAGKYIVSGSWDQEARIWPVGKWECDAVLKGHSGSVWAVLAYDPGTIITGCADKNIRVYHRGGKLLQTITGNADVVRALCRVPKGHSSTADFASAGNDAVIRLWSLAGHQIASLHGHANFIYSLASTPSGELVSAGEDRTLRIWRGYECIQSITHPAISVWGVAVCVENGDIVSGSSDRIVRVFTKDPARIASAEIIEQFDSAVKESSIPQEALGETINKEKLPGPEFLQQKSGTKEGQVQMINQPGGAVTAHMWSGGQWVSVGTVVNAVGSSGKKVDYLGKEYDYVFDVDIEDGKPALKLPYNLSQNPYEAATKFIQDNELPMTYLDQVANFITTNTQGATIGQTSQSTSADPWGSDSRYRPGDASNQPAAPPPPKLLPQRDYLSILVSSLPKLVGKVEEINTNLLSTGQKDVAFNPSELESLTSLRAYLEAATTTLPPKYSSEDTPASQAVKHGLPLALKIATMWPFPSRLPGLDLLRLLAPEPSVASYVPPSSSEAPSIIDLLIPSITAPSSDSAPPPSKNHTMMLLRFFANLFLSPSGRSLAFNSFLTIHTFVISALSAASQQGGDRNTSVAVTTLWINYAVLFNKETELTKEEEETVFECLLKVMESLKEVLESAVKGAEKDSEVVYRALVAVGTLLCGGDEVKGAGKDVLGLGTVVEGVKKAGLERRVDSLTEEIAGLLQ